MSAAEVIELIKKLPPEEKAKVIAFAKNAVSEVRSTDRKVSYVSQEKFAAITPAVFTKHDELFRRLAQ